MFSGCDSAVGTAEVVSNCFCEEGRIPFPAFPGTQGPAKEPPGIWLLYRNPVLLSVCFFIVYICTYISVYVYVYT